MKAIPTTFNGQRFRSRLEARWAVFFLWIGQPCHYEPEGFVLRDERGEVCYLPDFWLPRQRCYIEIKPVDPTREESRKARLLAQHTEQRVLVFCGQPGFSVDGGYPDDREGNMGAHLFGPGDEYAWGYCWCLCKVCGAFGVESKGRVDGLPCGHGVGDRGTTFDDPRLIVAYDTANRWGF